MADAKQDGAAQVLKTINYQDETVTGWKHVELDLSDFKNEAYVIVKFSMASLQSAEQKTVIVFDDLRIGDKTQLGIQSVSSQPKAVRKGIYRLDGSQADTANGLKKGIYIIDGRKAVIK